MTTDNHTPIPSSPQQAANAATFNSRFSDLDAAIGALATLGTVTQSNLVAAIGTSALTTAQKTTLIAALNGLQSEVDAAENDIAALSVLTSGIASTTVDGTQTGSTTLNVADGSSFPDSAYIAYANDAGTIEYRQISSGGGTNALTLDTAHTGVTDGDTVTLITASEYLARSVFHWGEKLYHPMAEGANGDGSTDDRGTLNTLANTTIGGNQATILIDRPYRIASAMTFPTNVELHYTPGGKLVVPTGVTITINGSIRAPLSQIFDLTGTGAISFGRGAVVEVYPEWFGGVAEDEATAATDNKAAIQAADDSVTSGGIVRFQNGAYLIGSQVSKSEYTTWIGVDGTWFSGKTNYGTILKCGFDGIMILADGDGTATATYGNGGMHQMTLKGDVASYPNSTAYKSQNNVRKQFFSRIYARGFGEAIFHIDTGGEMTWQDCFTVDAKYGWRVTTSAGDMRWINCLGGTGPGSSLAGYGWHCTNMQWVQFTNCRLQVSNEDSGSPGTGDIGIGCYLDNCRFIDYTACIFDANEQYGLFIQDSAQINVIGGQIADNGTTANNFPGVKIKTTSGGDDVGKRIRFIGVNFFDRQTGTVDEKQDRGIIFEETAGSLDQITLVGCDFSRLSGAALTNDNLVADMHVMACPGIDSYTENKLAVGASSPTFAGMIHAYQGSASGDVAGLFINQKDVDKEFMRVVGAAASADLARNIVAEGDVSTATRAGFLMVYVQDDGNQISDQKYFLPLFTLA